MNNQYVYEVVDLLRRKLRPPVYVRIFYWLLMVVRGGR
jgi:hypothetical protein